MSQKNVEVAREAFQVVVEEAIMKGEVDRYLEFHDPDVEWLTLATIVEGTRYHGHDGVRQWIEDVRRDWITWEVHPDEFIDLGDRILVLGSWRAQGRHGGAALEVQQAAWLLKFRGGKIYYLETFTERSKALEAAGLPE